MKTPTSLKPDEILLKTAVASLCHTDTMVNEGKFYTPLPCTASHEGTGVVVAVGDNAKDFKIGERVMAGIAMGFCHECINCRGPDDWHQYCPNNAGLIGVTTQGCFAEYVVANRETSCHIPDKVSFASAAPLACAGITIYRAVIVAGVKKGGWLAIVGAGGGLGHLGIQFAKAKGINIVAVDARDEGLDLCKHAGAEHVFDARDGKEKVVEQIQKITGGDGVEATINVSEHETSAPLSCAITRMHGTMVQVSQPQDVSVPFREIIFRDIHIVGSLMSGPGQAQEMLDECGRAGISVQTNIFHGLNEVPKMVELAHSGKMKGKAVTVVNEDLMKGEEGKY